MHYLLDTNICIYLSRGAHSSVIRKFATLSRGDAAISSLTLAELTVGLELAGVAAARESYLLGAVLERAPSLPFDDSAARCYARLTARLPSPDRRRNVIDRMIAAHAISLDVTLVTNNERDFVAYSEAGGLRVENWVAA
ncbi:MAG: type II toxin-antitoxin system VapC family toxin [Rhizobacter sp.]|nr:type II toxin-antitoxin system VapC family toxin [Burkholderiales bacterium]